MTSLFVDCPTGLAGDMLLAAFLDLGVPEAVIHEPLRQLGFGHAYSLKVEEASSGGLRGVRLVVKGTEAQPPHRHWCELRERINGSSLAAPLRQRVLAVFEALADAEAAVHGTNPEAIHFHEVGAIDSLVDVVGVCAALEHLQVSSLLCTPPPAGRGTVATAHGVLPVPVPAVLELARRHGVTLRCGVEWPEAELTTPTGLALMALQADGFGWPSVLEPFATGVGLGHRQLDRPNLLRLIQLQSAAQPALDQPQWQALVVQEAWIDDASAEAIAWLVAQLRSGGALDVACAPIQMKKGRAGTAVTALVRAEHAEALRQIWWRESPTLGLRERQQGRWVLPRRRGTLVTSWGDLAAKQTRRPDGQLEIKPERDALQQLADQSGLSPSRLLSQLRLDADGFQPCEDWRC
ncbi:MAG: nickel pincer cofactor biosynthesis protein LarC [Synechococcus sp.]|uniref:nickel pincer cofactor biosynthesis protein LarC n=1 Tax=Synechococcus sp. BMK-MC-1 TaxID=1442551 RepID=UPI0016493F44|nr:nickel pincer cofactor biosynthesis protein LarC [Synechococcus sp. BMK-MC-1]QNI68213.1 putative pyridinium-3/5-bisthiocarboxylic acid mononucleotide nickel chelatase [Synechococcus sp. BMK-MC-1]